MLIKHFLSDMLKLIYILEGIQESHPAGARVSRASCITVSNC
jgi:hypothetical protein